MTKNLLAYTHRVDVFPLCTEKITLEKNYYLANYSVYAHHHTDIEIKEVYYDMNRRQLQVSNDNHDMPIVVVLFIRRREV